jgi:starch phosphorylase
MEFLIGRTLGNALAALDLDDGCARPAPRRHAAARPAEREADAALGNGGLGRLAACFLDSMATLGLPSSATASATSTACSPSRSSRQQVEHPDDWLKTAPVGVSRARMHYPVRFGGWVSRPTAGQAPCWRARERVRPRPTTGHPGHGTERQHAAPVEGAWRRPDRPRAFNRGDYARAAEFKNQFENISWVLYPDDSTPAGASCACAGVLLRQRVAAGHPGAPPARARHADNLADKVAIHLNDTHPAIGVAELMRLLVDEHGCPGSTPGHHARRCSATPTTR